jgi:ribosomal protein L7/L12
VAEDLEVRIRALEERVAALEQSLAAMSGTGLDAASDLPDGVMALLSEGKRVEAVKRYMKVTGTSLKEATYASDRVDLLGRKPVE